MIIVRFPPRYIVEKRYIVEVILREFLGLQFEVLIESRTNWALGESNSDKAIIIQDCLFQTPSTDWLKSNSLPKQPLKHWLVDKTDIFRKIKNQSIPVIFGKSLERGYFYQATEDLVRIGIDIFGSAFFMLTRYEESIKRTRDQFDRFPASASLAHQENFLSRPIVNEYVEILWTGLKTLWPQLKRKSQTFMVQVSHDVDIPYRYAFSGLHQLGRDVAVSCLKRRNIQQGLSQISSWHKVKSGLLHADPCNTFDWLMDQSESAGLKSSFYFITDHSDNSRDGDYHLYHPLMRRLLSHIHSRGHEIGLHPSFNTYLDVFQTRKEFEILKRVCLEESIDQSNWGGRQHYLRWRSTETWQNWNDVGLSYDSTVGFADFSGFRCGTCYEFSTYNLRTRKALKLIERPLIVMECSILDDRYMGLNHDLPQAFSHISMLKNICRKFGGNFTLLWHNSRLENLEIKELYQQVLSA